MARNLKYIVFFVGLYLLAISPLQAQYSEQDLLKEANALFEQGRYAEAMPKYTQLLSINPTKPEFNYKYGATSLYGDASKKEDAIKYLKFAAGKPNVDNRCYYFLGRAYHLNYQFADALRAYEKFKSLTSSKEQDAVQVNREMEACRNGQNLLSNIKDVVVLDKKQSQADFFFRLYDLSDIGGRILVTPDELLSSLDKKNNHKSLIHFRGAGSVVYFSSYGKDGKNGLDIYQAQVLPDGKFTNPVPVEGRVNTPYDEDYPFMHPDNQTFYFSSKGHSSMGGYDIFRSAYDRNQNVFGPPENLDFAINTPDDDIFYIADSLNYLANFASARSSKQGELHVYKVEVTSAPMEITMVKGSFANKISGANKTAKITVIDAATNRQLEVQYTDPATGDYLLSFPKSGKYKFLVEAKNSEKVHTGIVDIPMSTGVSAYLQEMELIASAGVEKLLINNLFDQKYSGDISELMQKLLRDKAALEINFDQRDAPAVVEVPEEGDNLSTAYNEAGFGAGKSNEIVLEEAEKRVSEYKSAQLEIQEMVQRAGQTSFESGEEAQRLSTKAVDLITQAESEKGDVRNKLMFEAGVAKMKAENAIRHARNARELEEKLKAAEKKAELKFLAARAQTDSLENALDSEDYESALAALKREKTIRESIDRIEDRTDLVGDVRAESIRANNEAKKRMERAANMRSEAEAQQSKWLTKQRQRESAKGKDAEKLDVEIASLVQDIAALKKAADDGFDEAEKLQEKALDENQQYEIMAALQEDAKAGLAVESGESKTIGNAELKALNSTIQDINPDKSSVAAYLSRHPEAAQELGSDQAAMAFRKRYLTADDEDLLATDDTGSEVPVGSDTDSNTTSKSGDANDLADLKTIGTKDPPDQGATKQRADQIDSGDTPDQLTSTDTPDQRAAKETSDQTMIKDSPDQVTSAELNEDVAAITPDDESFKEQKTAGSDNKDTATPANTETAESTEDLVSDGAVTPVLEVERKDGTITSEPQPLPDSANDTALKSDEREVDEIFIDSNDEIIVSEPAQTADEIESIAESELQKEPAVEGETQDVVQRIEAEKIKINASKDWIAIIDESIKEMEKGIGGGEESDDDMKVQLAEYRRLKIEKLDEIKMGEEKLAILEREQRADQSVSIAAVERAENDVDTLDASLIARLESRISDANTNLTYIRKIDAIDRNYLPELTSVELSGESAPEISTKRIALNEKFIASLDQIIMGDAVSEIPQEDLLEIRRIKTLELIQDREIAEGKSVYAPRTTEAKEYGALLTEDKESPKPAVKKELALSPALEESLSKTYSRDLILVDYEDRMAKSKELPSKETEFKERIAVNSAFLAALQTEIDILSAAVKANEGNPSDRLTKRYNQLLQERSVAVDEINGDKLSLADMQMFGEEDEQELAMQNVLDTSIYQFNNVAEIDSLFISEMEEIKRTYPDDETRMKEMARLNRRVAGILEVKIDALVTSLDQSTNESERNLLQSEIQELDNIVADKLQEADRLTIEAESSHLAEKAEQSVVDDELISELNETETDSDIEISPDNLQYVIDQPAAYANLEYKSLNANISLSSLQTEIEAAESQRERAKEILIDFNETNDPVEKKALYTEFQKVTAELAETDRKVNEDISLSNQAEIAYYTVAAERISDEIQAAEISDEVNFRVEQATSNMVEIQEEIDENRELINATDDAATADKAALLKNELELIREMGTVHTELLAIKKSTISEPEKELADEGREENNLTRIDSEPVPVYAFETNPANNQPLRGNTYLTAVNRKYAALMDDRTQADLIAQDQTLQVEKNYPATETEAERFALIKSNSGVDDVGLSLLAKTPEKLEYLTRVISVDSLRNMETAQASLSKTRTLSAEEYVQEAARLREVAETQNAAADKKEILDRADKLQEDAEVNYRKAAIAAEQAEAIRAKRIEGEQEIASLASKLNQNDLAELNGLMDVKPYSIVPSDLTSADVTETDLPPTLRTGTRKESEKADEKALSSEESTVSGTASDQLAETAPVIEEPTAGKENKEEVENDIIPKGPNWLAMVEIIAEKTDFSDVKKSMFVAVPEPIYSSANPIPIDPPLPNGLIFQVQIGAFRNKIPQDLFKEFAPVMGQNIGDGITRYRAGIFPLYKEAVMARNAIRMSGYNDAFVVAYLNGELLTGDQAAQILAQARVKESFSVADEVTMTRESEKRMADLAKAETLPAGTVTDSGAAAEGKTTDVHDYYADPEAAAAEKVEIVRGLFFTVQVGVYSKPVKLENLYNLTDLNSELTASKTIRYTTGRFPSVNKASVWKSKAIEAGVTDAFITAYYNGKRISLSEANNLLEQEGEGILSEKVVQGTGEVTQTPVPAEVKSFVVVLGNYEGDVPQELANIFLERSDMRIRRIRENDGSSTYMSQAFDSRSEAEAYLEKCREAGLDSAKIETQIK